MIQKIGTFLFVIGVIAIIMNFFNYVPKLLTWIYNWGEGPAWGIKIAFIVVGAALWFVGGRSQSRKEV